MDILFISRQLMYKIINTIYIVIFTLSFWGKFYEISTEKQIYVLVLIVLLVCFCYYYYYIIQNPQTTVVKKGSGTRYLLGLLLICNVIVQSTGSAQSILFPLYYLFIFLVVLQYSIRIAYYSIAGIALLEYGSLFFHNNIETNGILLLIKLIFLLLLVFVVDSMMALKKSGLKKDSHSLISTSRDSILIDNTDTIELLSKKHESKSRITIDNELREILLSLVSLIKNIYQPYTCAIFNYIKKNKESVLYIAQSESNNLKLGTGIKAGEGLIGWIIKEKKQITVGDLSQDSRTLLYYSQNEKIQSFIGIPFFLDNNLEGILILDSTRENAFESNDLSVLINFSQLIASFIHKSRLMLELKESKVQFTGFYEISKLLNSHLNQGEVIKLLIDVVKKMFHYDRITLIMFDEKKNQLTIKTVIGENDDMPEGTPIDLNDKGQIVWVFKNKEAALIPDLERGSNPIPRYKLDEDNIHGFKSLLAVPLLIEHDPIGVISLESKTKNEYTHRDKEKISTVMNISEMALAKAQLYHRMENLATMDGLTNLANHRHFQDIVSEELQRADRYKKYMTLLMVDIDYFKKINDTYGHQMGDYVLTQTAKILKNCVREVDLVARYGGEEFAILLTDNSSEEALITAERIRKSIKKNEFRYSNEALHITASIGIATYPDDSDNQANLIRSADKALYLAKDSGRDCIKNYKDL